MGVRILPVGSIFFRWTYSTRSAPGPVLEADLNFAATSDSRIASFRLPVVSSSTALGTWARKASHNRLVLHYFSERTPSTYASASAYEPKYETDTSLRSFLAARFLECQCRPWIRQALTGLNRLKGRPLGGRQGGGGGTMAGLGFGSFGLFKYCECHDIRSQIVHKNGRTPPTNDLS